MAADWRNAVRMVPADEGWLRYLPAPRSKADFSSLGELYVGVGSDQQVAQVLVRADFVARPVGVHAGIRVSDTMASTFSQLRRR